MAKNSAPNALLVLIVKDCCVFENQVTNNMLKSIRKPVRECQTLLSHLAWYEFTNIHRSTSLPLGRQSVWWYCSLKLPKNAFQSHSLNANILSTTGQLRSTQSGHCVLYPNKWTDEKLPPNALWMASPSRRQARIFWSSLFWLSLQFNTAPVKSAILHTSKTLHADKHWAQKLYTIPGSSPMGRDPLSVLPTVDLLVSVDSDIPWWQPLPAAGN